ncbi:MAG: penicillin-binding protein 2, partial [Spirochaetia bacterium]
MPRRRLYLFGGLIVVVSVGYLAYLFSLQVVRGYIYELRAEQVTRRSLVIAAPRGEIYDRNVETPIATSRESFAIDLNPAEIPRESIDDVFYRLSEYLGMPILEIYDKIPERRYTVYQPIEIASGLSFRTITYIAEHKPSFPGVSWRIKPVRYYPDGDVFSHVLGYVGDITPEELQILYNRGYTALSIVGKAGVEFEYDEILRGASGRQFRTVDAQGRRVGNSRQADIPPEQGLDVVLTLDRKIQTLVQDAIGERIGAALVLKPATGEVLAMVSYPTYNANFFHDEGGSDYFTEVSLDPRGSFINRTIQAQASPASTFKVLMTTAVIEEKAFPIDQTVYDPGYRQYGDRVFKCWKQFGHGEVALFEALAESCNVFFYTMGTDYLGRETIIEYSTRFGLGERTGIDLPGEKSGLVPTPAWKERTRNTPWVGGDTVNFSIGQGFLQVTPIQMANLVAMIVNEGVVYQPHVVREIRDPVTREVVQAFEPEVLRTSSIAPETFRMVQDAMTGVILNGTPQIVMTTNAPMGGKTGTTQTGTEEERHSWFIGFASSGSDDLEDYVVTVVWIDAKNEWDWWGQYATNIIIHGIYNDLDYEETIADLRTLRDPWLWYGRGIPDLVV